MSYGHAEPLCKIANDLKKIIFALAFLQSSNARWAAILDQTELDQGVVLIYPCAKLKYKIDS